MENVSKKICVEKKGNKNLKSLLARKGKKV